MKHFRICGASCIEKTFAAIGGVVAVGALFYLLWEKCSLCKNGCHCHGEFGTGSGTPDVTMDFAVNPQNNASANN